MIVANYATAWGIAMLGLVACGGAERAPVPDDSASTRMVAGTAAGTPVGNPAPPEATAPAPRRVVLHGVDLTGIGYDEGDPKAPVVFVNFSDFGCPFCGTFSRETYPPLKREYVNTGKVFFKYVPFVMGMFPNGDKAARAAECAADQGKFWPMHDRLYADQAAWKRGSAPSLVFERAASALGLDRAGFDVCFADGRTDVRTAAATDRAMRLGVRVTPSFFIGDRLVEGALPLEQFRVILTEGAR